MQKKFFLLINIFIISLGFHACTLPSSVEFRLNPDLSLPVSEGSGSIIDSFFGDIKSNMEASGGLAYKFTEAQAPVRDEPQKFLIRYPVLESELSIIIAGGIDDSFPGVGDDPINFKEMFDIIKDFDFKTAEAYLYIDGPDEFFTSDPKITMEIKDGAIKPPYDAFDVNDLKPTGDLKIDINKKSGIINIKEDAEACIRADLPKNKNSYVLDFVYILNDRPEDLRFEYKVEITQPISVQSEAELLTIDFVLILPMDLVVNNPDGGTLLIPIDALTEKDDLFDREESGGSSYLDYMRNLYIGIGFNYDVFAGGELFMRRAGETEGNEFVRFPLTGTSISINVPQEKLDILNTPAYYPFKVDDIGIWFKYPDELLIPADLEAVNIHIDAELHYKIEF